jgi:hypothetical protein
MSTVIIGTKSFRVESQAATLWAHVKQDATLLQSLSNKEIQSICSCNPGRASNIKKDVIEALGLTTATTATTAKSDKQPILGISNAMRKGLQTGIILNVFNSHPATYVDSVDGSTLNPAFTAFMQGLLRDNEIGFNALFADCPISDFQLIGIETPSMRAKRIAAAELLEAQLQSALSLVCANGYRVVRNNTPLFAEFQSTENLRTAELQTLASLEVKEQLAESCAVKARIDAKHAEKRALIDAMRADRAKAHTASIANQVTATAEIMQDNVSGKITEAMAAANAALAEKQALQAQLDAVLAQLAAMQASQPAKPASKTRRQP